MRNPYEILGVEPSASRDQIVSAYHELARGVHPDRNPGHDTAESFHRLAASYQLLCDERARRAVDRLLAAENAATSEQDVDLPPDVR